jgi:hypothetical protein
MVSDANKRNSLIILCVDIHMLKFENQAHNFRPAAMHCHMQCGCSVAISLVHIKVAAIREQTDRLNCATLCGHVEWGNPKTTKRTQISDGRV